MKKRKAAKKWLCILTAGLIATGGCLAAVPAFAADTAEAEIVADWKFDSDYFASGSLETGDLVIQDASGNGNNLELNTERVESGKTAADYMSFPEDSIQGESGTESLSMNPKSPSEKKIGAFFETVSGAPMNTEEFKEGYTIEAIIKIPDDSTMSAWSSVFGQKGTGKLAGMTGGEVEANGGLNISSSGELQWNPWTTNNAEIQTNPTTWSDAGGIQRNKWHHIVIKNDGHSTVMVVDGIQVQRCNTFEEQVGIATLGQGENAGWVVGTAYWSGADAFSEAACGDAIFSGYIQEIRMAKGAVDPEDYLVTKYTIDDRYNISGNNDPYQGLASRDNYTFAVIPDPQYQTQYKPEIVDAQLEWIRDNTENYNIAMSICVGDLTQDGTQREFNLADQAFSILDEANLPYLITDGNHDGELFKTLFSGERYEGDRGYQGTGPSGISSYFIIRAGSYEYLFLSLPWNDADLQADRDWILNVLDTHRQYPTIVLSNYNTDTATFVEPFDQVFMTVRGHITDRWLSSFQNDYGHEVIDLVSNFQFDLYGGNGWMTGVEFDESANTISFQSYSPWVEKKMKILNGDLENNGILLPDEMQLFPFDKLHNTLKDTDNTQISFDFAQRFAGLQKVDTQPADQQAAILQETIQSAQALLESANRLQYADSDWNAFSESIASAEEAYAAFENNGAILPVEELESQLSQANSALLQAVDAFKNAAKPVTGIQLSQESLTLRPGETAQLEATITPEDAVTSALHWTSSDESVATVDQNGLVTALKEGTVTITASSTDGSQVTASAQITVVPKDSSSQEPGGGSEIPDNSQDSGSSSGNNNVATGDYSGIFLAVGAVILVLALAALMVLKKQRAIKL